MSVNGKNEKTAHLVCVQCLPFVWSDRMASYSLSSRGGAQSQQWVYSDPVWHRYSDLTPEQI